ncbi:MAG TPA: MFS transporter [Terriglobales bacterium]|nr:MFS transporter [Terriglobales bacterium]
MRRNLILVYLATFLRSLGVGLLSVVLGVYLARIGFSATKVGVTVAYGLAGGILATLLVTYRADRLGRRRTLVLLALLSAVGGLGLAFLKTVPEIFAIAFLGMVNGTGSDRGPAYALEQATVPSTVPTERRTSALAWYSLLLDTGHALGALAGGLPILLGHRLGMDLAAAYRITFLAYLALNALCAPLYLLLSREAEVTAAPETPPAALTVTPETKKVVGRLARLFALDALGGGFLIDALVSYWFFRRFGLSEEQLGVLFFVVHILNALSYLVAARLARRIGLLNTMVFTHIPSSLFLIAVPFAPTAGWAMGLFLAREALVEMDVPTRQSYVMAVVEPQERTYASGITNLTRNAAWAVGSSFAGVVMQYLALAAPLVLGGSVKILYDGLLYRAFCHLKPPEERSA